MPEHPEKRKIIWQYWQHPLGVDNEWVDVEDARPSDALDYGVGDESDDLPSLPYAKMFIVSPAGLMPKTAFTSMSKAFDMWMGHANFYITKNVANQILQYPGVTLFEPLSPYSFIISFGLAFLDGDRNAEKLRIGLEEDLGVFRKKVQSNDATAGQIETVVRIAKEAGTLYSVLVLPNNILVNLFSTNQYELGLDVELLTAVQRAVGGELFHSNLD